MTVDLPPVKKLAVLPIMSPLQRTLLLRLGTASGGYGSASACWVSNGAGTTKTSRALRRMEKKGLVEPAPPARPPIHHWRLTKFGRDVATHLEGL